MKRLCGTYYTKLFTLLLCMGLVSGCATLPDIAPFVTATSSMSSSVISSGTTVETELRLMGDAYQNYVAQNFRDHSYSS